MLVLVVLLDFAGRRAGRERRRPARSGTPCSPSRSCSAPCSAAGSLADHGDRTGGPACRSALACAALGFFAARSLFARVRRRLDAEAAGALPVYAEGAALGAAGAVASSSRRSRSLIVAGLVWLLVGVRRREGEKYAGLRILR